jgi:hypothetical protein
MRARWLAVLVVPLLLGSSSRPRGPSQPEPRFHLKLHVTRDGGGFYFTAWADGQDVVAGKDAADRQVVTYHRRYIWFDHCTWDASEQLTPIDATHYAYTYRENPVSCPDGASAEVDATTPRDGKVTVVPADDDRPLTPLTAWTEGWDHAR